MITRRELLAWERARDRLQKATDETDDLLERKQRSDDAKLIRLGHRRNKLFATIHRIERRATTELFTVVVGRRPPK